MNGVIKPGPEIFPSPRYNTKYGRSIQMIRNLKILGLAVVALCAFASSAQAIEFHSEGSPTRLTLKNDGEEGTATAHHVFVVSNSPITCKGIEGSGTASSATETTQTIEPVYKNCTFLGVNVTVNMNGCDYVFNVTTKLSENDYQGSVVVGNRKVAGVEKNCATEPISYNASGLCTVTVGPQTLNGITYHNLNIGGGTKREVTVSASVGNIHAVKTGAFCPSGAGTVTNGQYTTGNTIVKGETDDAAATQKGVWVE